MNQLPHNDGRSVYDSSSIPTNRSEQGMPSAVREFAELLAEIAVRQLRTTQNISQGEIPHV